MTRERNCLDKNENTASRGLAWGVNINMVRHNSWESVVAVCMCVCAKIDHLLAKGGKAPFLGCSTKSKPFVVGRAGSKPAE